MSGNPQVEQDKIEALADRGPHRRTPGLHPAHAVPVGLQRGVQRPADRGVVLHD